MSSCVRLVNITEFRVLRQRKESFREQPRDPQAHLFKESSFRTLMNCKVLSHRQINLIEVFKFCGLYGSKDSSAAMANELRNQPPRFSIASSITDNTSPRGHPL
ncbi:hypothetical protein PROFUN_09153 [Planoprotostelium fungivorum]|uniref:Uncharacterized protein n=1 Tax=Planoprotostelium fungivorum TaxID=1890364 RepID=A0A2P6MVJ8_9EUKA|nr:hypothetical protein PROFUN_09153 [Planoprotostelium fungivorum]